MPDLAFTGSETTWSSGDVSSIVLSGSTYVMVRFKNIGDFVQTIHYRKTGSSEDDKTVVQPTTDSNDITIELTSARTIEYYIEGGGSLECYIVTYWGTGIGTTTVTVDDIRTHRLISSYTTSDIPDADILDVLEDVTNEVTNAATRHYNINGVALTDTQKVRVIKEGTVGWVITNLYNKGVSQGMQSSAIRASIEAARMYITKYEDSLNKIRVGTVY